jgi:hypothetical protein
MRVLAASLLIALSPMASLADDGGSLGTQSSTNQGQSNVAGRIASEFTRLAGGRDNALALVNGLRNGTGITLTTKVPSTGTGGTTGGTTGTTGSTGGTTGSTGGTTGSTGGTGGTGGTTGTTGGTMGTTGGSAGGTTTTTITPDTGKMGWGEVKIALALAEASLKQAGITKPTPEQLQAALNGGDVTVTSKDGTTTTTTLKGVLAQRASGMGWGQIAHTDGTTVGKALKAAQAASHSHLARADGDDDKSRNVPGSSKASKNAAPSTASSKSATVATATAKSATVGGKSITTAGGTVSVGGSKSSKGIMTAGGASGVSSHGSKGITTASGAGAGSGSHITTAQGGAGGGNAHAYGRGVVTGAGGSIATTVASASGSSHAASSAGLVTASGSAAGSGITTAHGGGNGHNAEHGKGGKAGG